MPPARPLTHEPGGGGDPGPDRRLDPGVRAGHGTWTEPGAYPVAPGIHRIPLPLPGDGLKAVNVYAVEDGDRIALVDAGWHRPESLAALTAGLRQIGAEVGDLSQILVTHVHHDHYGQAPPLRRASGAVVVLGEGERVSLEAIVDPLQRAEMSAERFVHLRRHGAGELADEAFALEAGLTEGSSTTEPAASWEPPDIYVPDRRRLDLATRTLEVVATPGHTRGHVSFLDETGGVLFAGDHVLPHITPSIGVEPFDKGLALIDFLESLALVRNLPARIVLPAHGPTFDDLTVRVDELLAHHADRLTACVDAVRTRPLTGFEVAHRLPWTRRLRAYPELDVFNRLLAVRETVSHLELLALEGTLRRIDDGTVVRFGVAGAAPA